MPLREIVFNEVTTGAENDLDRATTLARQMVCLFGMSEAVGLARCVQRQGGMFLPGADGAFQRDCSEETARQIDTEVKSILDNAYTEAKDILQLHRAQVELVTQHLLAVETIDAATFQKLIGQELKNEDRPSQTPVSP